MQLLFVTEHYYPNRNANGNCIWHLVKEFERLGHKVTVLSKAVGREQAATPYDGETRLSWYRFDADMRASEVKALLRKNPVLGAKAALLTVMGKLFLQKSRSNPPSMIQTFFLKNAILKELKKFPSYDAVIAGVFPVETALACSKLARTQKLTCSYYLYQMDSYIDNFTLKKEENEKIKRMRFASFFYKNAKGVFAHPLQKKELSQVNCNLLNKTHFIEFPLLYPLPLLEKKGNVSLHEDNKSLNNPIHCLFLGRLYPDIRPPDDMFSLFLTQASNVYLDVVGTPFSHDYMDYTQKMHNRLHFYGEVSPQEARAFLQTADILVNIGNKPENQLPSKIFEYFSTGKPIINIVQSYTCPTIPYMNRYRNAITICNKDGKMTATQIADLKQFIQSASKRQHLPFAEVKTLFKEATPEYVVRCMLQELEQ